MDNIELPPGWTAVPNRYVGVDINDEFGNIRLQHYSLTPSIAAVAWDMYRTNPLPGPREPGIAIGRKLS